MSILTKLVLAAAVIGNTAVPISVVVGKSAPPVTGGNETLLQLLNSIRLTKINPALHAAIPDPLTIDASKGGTADAGCIIPGPFHDCICHASASYNVELTTVHGANNLEVDLFTAASVVPSGTNYTISAAATISLNNAEIDGNVHAGVDACGIKPSASGSCSTDAATQGTLEMNAVASLNTTGGCIDIVVTSITLSLPDVKLSNIHVDIDLAGIHIDVGSIVDLINELIPSLSKEIVDAITPLVSKLLPGVITNALPCVPL